MLRIWIGDEVMGCKDRCPARRYFKVEHKLEGPSIYDDYFRKLAPDKFPDVQAMGIQAMAGAKVPELWDFLMDMSIYTGNGLFDDRLIEGYESAKEYIDKLESAEERRRLKWEMAEKMKTVHSMLRKPGDELDSLKSFGAFLHLMITGTAQYLEKKSLESRVNIEIVPDEDENSLEPYVSFFENAE